MVKKLIDISALSRFCGKIQEWVLRQISSALLSKRDVTPALQTARNPMTNISLYVRHSDNQTLADLADIIRGDGGDQESWLDFLLNCAYSDKYETLKIEASSGAAMYTYQFTRIAGGGDLRGGFDCNSVATFLYESGNVRKILTVSINVGYDENESEWYVDNASFVIVDARKQDVIADLNQIRQWAISGARAYQKPYSGIPKSDLASDVQASLGKADTAVQPSSVPFQQGSGSSSAVQKAGNNTSTASAQGAFATGELNVSSGKDSASFNRENESSGSNSFTTGRFNKAPGAQAASFGNYTRAPGTDALSGGLRTTSSGDYSVSFGRSGTNYDPETEIDINGNYSVSSAEGSFSFGYNCKATAKYSQSFGDYTYTLNRGELSMGRYNVSHQASTTFGNKGNTLFSAGIGTGTSKRKNAIEGMQNGEVYLIGVGGYDGTNAGESGILSLQEVLRAEHPDKVDATKYGKTN